MDLAEPFKVEKLKNLQVCNYGKVLRRKLFCKNAAIF